jgi:preprotein translocase subunit YajC
MNTLFITLQAAAPAGQEGNPYQFLILIGGMFVIMYFFMIRPQMKRQKEAKKFRESLSKGDSIVTIGGVHGKVLEITDTNVLVQVDNGKLRIEKSAISSNHQSSEQDIAAAQK